MDTATRWSVTSRRIFGLVATPVIQTNLELTTRAVTVYTKQYTVLINHFLGEYEEKGWDSYSKVT